MFNRVPASLTFLVLFSVTLFAQLASKPSNPDLSEEAFVFEHLNESVRFENDGSGLRETTAVVRINSQAGVQAFGQLVFGYSTANEDLSVDYVRVRRADGQVVETPASTFQDFAPEILREAPMYSDFRERHISVMEIQPGVTLEYHTIIHVKPLATGEFWYEYSFPTNLALTDATLQIDLPKAREIKLKSDVRKYETHDKSDRRIYKWTVSNFVPDRAKKDADDDDSNTPDVQLSSFADWHQLSRWYAELQSARATPDENRKKRAAELTRGVTSQDEKARRLYTFVGENIRYVSLSFGVGRFQPHAASEVLQNGYGDCKDKHTLLQAMLAAQGIQSYPVLISTDRKLDVDVPSPAQFDHVITAVKLGGENFTWLDATAEVAPYGLIAYSLRNKEAVIASSDSSAGLQRTPAEAPVRNTTTWTITAKASELGSLDADVKLEATGDSDWPLRGTFRRLPQANWARGLEALSRLWGLPGDVSDVRIEAIEDTTKPLRLSYHLHKVDYFKVPNSGANFQLLPPMSFGRVPKASKKHASEPLDVGPAEERIYRVHFEFPGNFSVHVPSEVSVTRDYGQYSTSYKLSKGALDAERRLVLKVNELPAMKRADYSSFYNVSTSAVEEAPWCSITRPSASALASAAEMKGTPAELRDAGQAALKRQDFSTAATLLQRAADQDPNSKEGWDELGQAYAGLKQHEKAVQAFQSQIEKDPYQAHAHAELAAELVQLGRFEDAIAAYRKQIEIAPAEKSSHKQLGLLFVQLKRDHVAQSELEAADAIPPEDPEIRMALAQLYSRTGDSKKSELMMASLTGGTAAAASNDLFAPALREDVDPTQAAHEAEKNLGALGDQFDSGEYDRLDANAFSAMDMVALSWARMGWARFLQGENVTAWQYLEAAWDLSLSGTVANRLGRVFEKTGARNQAEHMYALAVAAGGPEALSSRQRLVKLDPNSSDKEISQAEKDLEKLRVIALPQIVSQSASARFILSFDNSTNPDRVQFLEGDESLRGVAGKLQNVEFPVKFPDVSSIKIVRMGTLSCVASRCSFEMQPLNSMQQNSHSEMAGSQQKP